LVARRQGAHRFDNGVDVAGNYSCNLSPPLRREVNANQPAVIALAHAPDPALFFEIVDYEGHVSARSQKLLRDFVLAEGAEMVQDLESSELAYG
jgi:hypothetical protein